VRGIFPARGRSGAFAGVAVLFQLNEAIAGPSRGRIAVAEGRMNRLKILAVAHAVPERVATNKELAARLGGKPDEILATTGVKERRYILEGEGNVSLAFDATQKACEETGIAVSEIDMIIAATSYPDHQFPGNSAFLQAKLGLAGGAMLDVRSQGTGFLTALHVAEQYIRTGMFKRILVVGSDIHSTALDFSPKAKAITSHFGDGAGVVIVGPAEEGDESGLLAVRLHTDAQFAFDWYVPLGSIQQPRVTKEDLVAGKQFPVLHWDIINREVVKRIPEVLEEACAAAEIGGDDIDVFLMPNFSSILIKRICKNSWVPDDKILTVKERFGDMGTASVPVGLSMALTSRKIKSGQIVAALAFGSGFGYGAAIFRW
jgi:3-oxoacyl-[acyl-carrier-protein] synthase-3